MSIRIGILGYGNLGRSVECAVREHEDMELVAVFTRRDPASVKIWSQDVPVVSVKDVAAWQDKIDVMILCGGSATDLPKQTPEYVKYFNVIDSFDTHARIPEHSLTWIRRPRKAAIWGSSRWAGIRACSLWHVSTTMRFCRMARIIRSGAKASARVTVMPSAASRASRMPSSTRSQLRVLLRLCAPARIRNLRRVRSTRVNALWSSKRVPMRLWGSVR